MNSCVKKVEPFAIICPRCLGEQIEQAWPDKRRGVPRQLFGPREEQEGC